MPGRSVKAEEVRAGAIVADQLGGEAKPRDAPGAPDASHDVDIELPGGRRIALEVTSAADTELLSMHAAAFGKTWNAPSLSSNWWISFDGGSPVEIKTLMRGLEAQLKVLEEHGVAEVSTLSHAQRHDAPSAVIDATRQILVGRITSARRWGASAPGESARMLLVPHRGLSAGGGQVNALVADAAEANVEKLLAANADERHLFVWIDEDAGELEMFAQLPPPSEPSLPDGIDAVWAATRGKTPEADFERLWRLQPDGGWKDIRADRNET
jgi:hypothetical protein